MTTRMLYDVVQPVPVSAKKTKINKKGRLISNQMRCTQIGVRGFKDPRSSLTFFILISIFISGSGAASRVDELSKEE